MNFPFYIARRYFFSRKLPNVIHIIAAISLGGIIVGAFALIVILSAFNGFEEVVSKLYNTFDPDLKAVTIKGKYFTPDSLQYKKLRSLSYVNALSPVLEDNVAVLYRDKQAIATFKAIEPGYLKKTGLDSMMVAGDADIADSNSIYALIGAGVSKKLALPGADDLHPLRLYMPKKTLAFNPQFPMRDLNQKSITAGGIFSVQQDFDTRYILLPLEFARQLSEEPTRVTSLELRLNKNINVKKAQREVQQILGDSLQVLDRFQQQPSLYKVMRSEKLAVYLILTFILLIAAFNMVGALLMLAIEKKKDMMILESFGATPKIIRNIILYQGLLLSFTGGLIGIGLGTLICWLQIEYGFVKIDQGGGTFVVSAYPVAFKLTDFVLVFFTVLVMGFLASWFPAHTAYKRVNANELKGAR